MYQFEKLKVWQESLILVRVTYLLIDKLPKSERFGITDQLRRSVTSICLNIAEGCGSNSRTEFKRFLQIGKKSLYETMAIFKIINTLFPEINTDLQIKQIDIVGKLLNGLINSINRESNN
ncbi:MAG: S23 ribosomal protein [Candidatus Berkelbacteria bacterium Licking1014_2]|uniref:S23 ribosomal protein n=1 Tax=Candidatus Berkelbacteria bacterium Licking1014_2 TaxID=2017146 RepID=A0A554LW00_9BACT|nr:MAG: S23 ribosomal protein [Candidatus Berkelbacteria bacterium Licking1014_2]